MYIVVGGMGGLAGASDQRLFGIDQAELGFAQAILDTAAQPDDFFTGLVCRGRQHFLCVGYFRADGGNQSFLCLNQSGAVIEHE